MQIMELWRAGAARSRAAEVQATERHTALRVQRWLRSVLRAWLEAAGQLRDEAAAAKRQQELFSRVTSWLESDQVDLTSKVNS